MANSHIRISPTQVRVLGGELEFGVANHHIRILPTQVRVWVGELGFGVNLSGAPRICHSSVELAGESRAQQTFADPFELSVTFRVCSSMAYPVVAQVEACWRLWTSTELRRSPQTLFSSEEHHGAKGRWARPLGFGGAQWSLVQLSRAR